MHTKKEKKLLKYFDRLNEENQDYILAEMIELYQEQTQESNVHHPTNNSNVIFVDFQNKK